MFRLIIFLASACLILSCKKDDFNNVKFNTAERKYDIVVEGGINTFQTTQYIRLSEPTFSLTSTSQPINGAAVTINDGVKPVLFKETSTPGVYSGVVTNNANYNKGYSLKIVYKNKTYTAVDTLRQVVNIIDDFLPLRCVKYEGNNRLTVPKHTFGFLNSSKWLIAYPGIPLWNPAKFDAAINYSYTHIQGSPNSIYPLINQTRIADLKPTDVISIYKFSLSDEYAKYLYSVFQETDWKGIFSTVPAEIKGNLSEGAVGFFYVIDVDLRRYKASELVN